MTTSKIEWKHGKHLLRESQKPLAQVMEVLAMSGWQQDELQQALDEIQASDAKKIAKAKKFADKADLIS